MGEPFITDMTGDVGCPHDSLTYFHSAYYEDEEAGDSGDYAVCDRCGMHLWEVTVPEGVKVIDAEEDEEDEEDDWIADWVTDRLADEAPAPLPTPERLKAWQEAVKEWQS